MKPILLVLPTLFVVSAAFPDPRGLFRRLFAKRQDEISLDGLLGDTGYEDLVEDYADDISAYATGIYGDSTDVPNAYGDGLFGDSTDVAEATATETGGAKKTGAPSNTKNGAEKSTATPNAGARIAVGGAVQVVVVGAAMAVFA